MNEKKERPNRGLLVCLSKPENGMVSLTLDDIVKQEKESDSWSQDCFVTLKEYPEELFDEMSFDEKELADFGYYILSRLFAFKQRGEI